MVKKLLKEAGAVMEKAEMSTFRQTALSFFEEFFYSPFGYLKEISQPPFQQFRVFSLVLP